MNRTLECTSEENRQFLEMALQAVERDGGGEDYQSLRLVTNRGEVSCRYYPVPEPHLGALWVGGVGGGWDTPARGLYPSLCGQLTGEAIASLRVCFRQPRRFEECVLDALAGVAYLQELGVEKLALTGHSLGGAVVIQAATRSPAVRTVVALATQSYGADPAGQQASPWSLLMIHGEADRVLPALCSKFIYRRARQPKRLILYPGAGHVLDEVAEVVREEVSRWIIDQLKGN